MATITPLGQRVGNIIYDERGRATQARSPEIQDASGLAGGLPAAPDPAVTPLPAGITTTRAVTTTRYFQNGWVNDTVDARGVRSIMQYDRAGRVVKTISGPSSVLTSIPASRSPFATLTNPSPTNVEVTVAETLYDRKGNPIAVRDAGGNVTLNTYDVHDRLTSTTTDPAADLTFGPPSGTLPSTAITVRNVYDTAGNLVEVVDGLGSKTRFLYDGANRKTATIWDPAADPQRTETTLYFGALPYRVVKATNSAYISGETISTTFDRLLRSVKVTCPSHVLDTRILTLDAWGRTTSITYPNDTRPAENATRQTFMRYDLTGRLVAEIAGGVQTRYRFDRAGNVLDVLYGHPGSASLSSTWVEAADVRRKVSSTYDVLNRLQTMSETGPDPGVAGTPQVTRLSRYYYNAAGDVVRKSQPGDLFAWHQYDGRGRLKDLQTLQKTGPSTVQRVTSSESKYSAAGTVTEVKEYRGTSTTPLRTVTNTYDKTYRLLTETDTPGSGPVTLTSYEYDAGNNRTKQQRFVGGTRVNNIVSSYYAQGAYNYATNNQPYQTWDGDTGQRRIYYYDANGNRIASETYYDYNTAGATGEPYYDYCYYEYDSANRLTLAYSENYDQFAYFAFYFNAASSFKSQTNRYAYDHRTRRVFREELTMAGVAGTAGDTVFTSEKAWGCAQGGGLTAQEYALSPIYSGSTRTGWSAYGSTQKPEAEFVRGSDWGGGVGGVLYTLRSGTGARYDAYNHRGDVVAQTDGTGTGATSWATAYDAFGKRVTGYESGTTADRQKANTHEEDPTGLINDGHRYRDPVTGTYLTRDPAGFVDGPNVYTYVRQNPWSSFDPEGLDDKPFWTRVGDTVWNGLVDSVDITSDSYAKTAGRKMAEKMTGIPSQEVNFLDEVRDIVVSVGDSYGVCPAPQAIARKIAGIPAPEVDSAEVVGNNILDILFIWGPKAVKSIKKPQFKTPSVKIGEVPPAAVAVESTPKTAPACFPARTEVAGESFPLLIEDIKPGAKVLAWDSTAKTWRLSVVVKKFEHDFSGNLITIFVGDEKLEATENHPFWVARGKQLASRLSPENESPEHGHSLAGGWVDARDLLPGDILETTAGRNVVISAISRQTVNQTVYNLEVKDCHTYAVSALGILVHNKVGPDEGAAGAKRAAAKEASAPSTSALAKQGVEKASDLPLIKPGSKEWEKAVKDLSALEKGKLNLRTENATDAKKLLEEARGKMDRRKQYTQEQYEKGYEVHNATDNERELNVGNDLQHIKWYDGKSGGHVYYDKPN